MKKIIAFLIVALTAFSFTSCKKEPIIGYEPEIPQEWIDEAERENNSPTTDLVRTTEFDGIWQLESTGKYYQFYSGHVFELAGLDSEDEAELWGTAVIVQVVEKEVAEAYDETVGYAEGEEFNLYLNSQYETVSDAKFVVVTAGKTKVTTESGDEFVFKFIREADDWPTGFNM